MEKEKSFKISENELKEIGKKNDAPEKSKTKKEIKEKIEKFLKE